MKNKYWMTCCHECHGKGQVVFKSPMYKVFTRLQDEGWELAKSFMESKGAKKYVKKQKKGFFGSSTMYAIVSPEGKIVGE